jgi:hypothetical protein
MSTRSSFPTALRPVLLIAVALVIAIGIQSPAQAFILPNLQPAQAVAVDGWIKFGSPTVADVNNDGDLEIAVGTANRKVYLFQRNGTSGATLSVMPGWPQNVEAGVGSAPAIGDVTGDGVPEIIFTSGTGGDPSASRGGAGEIYVFSVNGTLLWKHTSQVVGATGRPGGIFGSPVLADLNGDNILDIVAAGFDQNIYAFSSVGGTKAAIPHVAWPESVGSRNSAFIWLGDGSWATPAIADIDGDGTLDIVITSATNIDARLSYVYPGWSDLKTIQACTKINVPDNADLKTLDYNELRANKRACGFVAVFNADGSLKPGWPQFIAGHTYDASPALADIDGDGKLEILTGNGDFFLSGSNASPSYVTAWEDDGSIKWRNTITNTGASNGWGFIKGGAPALGDIDGDGKLEVVVGSNNTKIYAYNTEDGSLINGFPVSLFDRSNPSAAPANQPLALADVNSDGKADIITGAGWDVRAISGSGQYLDSALVLETKFPIAGAPAVADIDNDGNLEVLIGSAERDANAGRLWLWDLSVSATGKALPWPQFQGNAHNTGYFAVPELQANTEEAKILVPNTGDAQPFAIRISDAAGGEIDWSASTTSPWILLQTSGSSAPAGSSASGTTPASLIITIDKSKITELNAPGDQLSTGTVSITSDAGNKTVNIAAIEVDELDESLFLPLIVR